MEIAFYIEQYASLSKTEKDLARVLFDAEKKFKQGIYQHVRRKRETLAGYARCCIKTVQRFNSVVKYCLIGVEYRKSKGKQQATNYKFDPEFFKAMVLLASKNLLYKDSKKILEFANFHRGNKNVPRQSEKCPPSLSDSSLSGLNTYGFVHPYIEKIGGLTFKERLALSSYPEHAIVEGVNDAVWYSRQGNKIGNIMALVQSRIRERLNGK